jgi:hypothetical protein
MAGPLYDLQPSKRGRTSGLSRTSVVLRPGAEGQSLATERTRLRGSVVRVAGGGVDRLNALW